MFIFIGPGLFTVLLPYGVLSSGMELFSWEIGSFRYIGVVPIVILFAYTVFLGLVCHLWVVYCEEPCLSNKFGAAYEEYCRTVPRWIPRLKR